MQQYHTLQQTHTIEPPPSPPLLLIRHLIYPLPPATPHPTPTIHPSSYSSSFLLLLIQHLLFIPPSYSLSYIFYSLIPPTPHPTSSIHFSLLNLIQHLLSFPPSNSSSNTLYPFLLLLLIQHLLSIPPSTPHPTPSIHSSFYFSYNTFFPSLPPTHTPHPMPTIQPSLQPDKTSPGARLNQSSSLLRI